MEKLRPREDVYWSKRHSDWQARSNSKVHSCAMSDGDLFMFTLSKKAGEKKARVIWWVSLSFYPHRLSLQQPVNILISINLTTQFIENERQNAWVTKCSSEPTSCQCSDSIQHLREAF